MPLKYKLVVFIFQNKFKSKTNRTKKKRLIYSEYLVWTQILNDLKDLQVVFVFFFILLFG